MNSSKASPVHRVTISESEIQSILCLIEGTYNESMRVDTVSFHKKLLLLKAKIDVGVKSPDYIPTPKLSLEEKLGMNIESTSTAILPVVTDADFDAAEKELLSSLNSKDNKHNIDGG